MVQLNAKGNYGRIFLQEYVAKTEPGISDPNQTQLSGVNLFPVKEQKSSWFSN